MAYIRRVNTMMKKPAPAEDAPVVKEIIPPFVTEQGRAHVILKELYNFVYIPRSMPYKYNPAYRIEREPYAIRALLQRGVLKPSPALIQNYLEQYQREIDFEEAAFNANHQILKRHLFRIRYSPLLDCYLYKVACLYAVCIDWFCANRIDVYATSTKPNASELPYAHKLGLAFPSFISTFFWNVLENEHTFGYLDTWKLLITKYRDESNKERDCYFSTKWYYAIRNLVGAGRNRDYDYANYKTIDKGAVTDFVANEDTEYEFNLDKQVKAYNVLLEIADFFNSNTEEWGIYTLPLLEAHEEPVSSSIALDWNPEPLRRPTTAAKDLKNDDPNVLVDHFQHRLINQALLGAHGFPKLLDNLQVTEQHILPCLMGDPTKVFLLTPNTEKVAMPARVQSNRNRAARDIVIDPSLLALATPVRLGQRQQETTATIVDGTSTLFSAPAAKKVNVTQSVTKAAKALEEPIEDLAESEAEEGSQSSQQPAVAMEVEVPPKTKQAKKTAAASAPPTPPLNAEQMQAAIAAYMAAQAGGAQPQAASARKRGPSKKAKAAETKE